MTRRRLSSVDLASLLLASGFCIIQFLRLHALIGPSAAPTMAFLRDPHATPTAAMGWWAWWDQGRYQSAAVAWAHGVTTARFHWYMPAYPLLGAPFVGLTPADPFLVPDLGCLIGTLWLFSALASRLLDDIRGSVPLACLLFVASTLVLPDRVLWAWVVPWTTTPETLCLFAALLAAVRLLERPGRRDAFLLGLAGVAIAGVRPVEAMIVLLLAGVVTVPVLLARRMLRPDLLAAALVGGLLPLGLFGAAYLAVWGPRLSPYVISSANIGFEPRLLPIRWVTLMIDPRPLYPDGRGLAEVFFWIAPGFAGMAATLVGTRRTLLPAHILVVATMCADIVLFLIYRDLHPTGLWRFGSFHYFKWTLPLFALYALRLPLVLTGSHGRRAIAFAAACLVVVVLFCWKAELDIVGPLQRPADGSRLTLAAGLAPMDAIVLLRGHGPDALPVVAGDARLGDGTAYHMGVDFVIYGGGGTLRIAPLRPLSAKPTTILFAPGTELVPGSTPVLARQSLRWGLPRPGLGGP